VAALFLPAKSIVYIQRDADDEEMKASIPDDNVSSDAPLVVLVDEGSASASEILAGALKDNDRAKVIGETTFGAGTVIHEYSLSDGSAIKLATDEWLTPNGNVIRGSGIEPDVEAGLKEGQGASTPAEGRGLSKEEISAKDAQLQRAYEVLQGA
jgi:carboxyl-terminal processing protease